MKPLNWAVSMLAITLIMVIAMCMNMSKHIVVLREKLNTKLSETDVLKNQYEEQMNALDKKGSEIARSLNKNTKDATEIYRNANFLVAVTTVSLEEELLGQVMSPSGSAFVVEMNAHTYIITARHVCFLREKILREKIEIHFKGVDKGEHVNTESAVMVDSCEHHDLAILEFKNKNFVFPWSVGKFAPSKNLEPGNRVFALGSPMLSFFSITEGVVMSTNIMDYILGLSKRAQLIRHSAIIIPGNSGGPLLDDFGRIVGMNVSTIGPQNESKTFLAVTSDCIVKDLNCVAFLQNIHHSIIDADFSNSSELGEFSKDWKTSPPKQRGVIATSVTFGSDAAGGGLKIGDLILRCDGVIPRDATEINEIITHKQPNSLLKLFVQHQDGKEEELNIKVSAMN